MERYHIFKLGWAITFYAVYCIRPMLVHSLDTDNDLDNSRNVQNPEQEYFQYLQGVEGRPGKDYPVHSYIPRTSFSCRGIESGYYADLDTDCQVFHICEEGKKISFLCPNGTIFQQSELICEWWNKVNCSESPNLYQESAERLQYEVARRKSSRRVYPLNGDETNHGAVIRMEERTSVRTTTNGKEYRVRQQIRKNRVKNHRIPDNNDIEQHIEEAESNNRHLANAQTQLHQTNPRQNYNTITQDTTSDFNNENPTTQINLPSSRQTKKDIDKHTGNYINANYDTQASNRHSKKVEQGAKNQFEFGSKTGHRKGATFKEYHVEFDSTISGVESSTRSYSSSSRANSYSTSQNLNYDRKKEAENRQNGDSPTTKGTSSFYSTEPTILQNTYQENVDFSTSSNKENHFQSLDSSSYTNNNQKSTSGNFPYDGSSTTDFFRINVPPSSTLAPSIQEYNRVFHGLPQSYNDFGNQYTESSKQNTNTNRGSIRYNTKSSYTDSQQTKEKVSSNNVKSVPVTTYSPPLKYASYKAPQNIQRSTEETPNPDSYDLPFPTHRAELINKDQSTTQKNGIYQNDFSNSATDSQVQFEQRLSSTESSFKQYPNHKSNESAERNSHDSDEAQVPEESSSFIKNSFNSITDTSLKTSPNPYPNHKSTYSDLRDLSYLEPPRVPSISSITAHLVTTQPINNGKPFVGSRVGTTLLPNQPTTQSKYTYLPTTSKPTVIFGVIRHSSTTEIPPYGPPELFNLGANGKPISTQFNIGINDKTLPTVETTTVVTNPTPTESFNIGSTESTIKSNVVPGFETSTVKSPEINIPAQGSLNVDTTEKANVRQRYQELESLSERFNTGSTKKVLPKIETTTTVTNPTPVEAFNIGSTDKSIPQYVVPNYSTTTFAPLNVTVPHHGSLNLGTNTANIKYGNQEQVPFSEQFNPDKNLPTVETTILGTNPVPTNAAPDFGASTAEPLEIYVPDNESFNEGGNEQNIADDYYYGREPVNEPPFVKKTVPLLYSNQVPKVSTLRTVDHATVYGNYISNTQRPVTTVSVTPYSPTVPTVTRNSIQSTSTPYRSASSTRRPKTINQGVPIRFENGQNKISVQLSKSFGGQSQTKQLSNFKNTTQAPLQKVNAVIHVADDYYSGGGSTTAAPFVQPSGFFVTKDFRGDAENEYSTTPKSVTERPRPFSKSLGFEDEYRTGKAIDEQNRISSIFPAYQISSARPFGINEVTSATPFTSTQSPPTFNVYENIDNMMDVLQQIANFNAQKEFSEDSRPGLIIPPSVGPQTLHSLAQYFANELQYDDADKEVLTPDTKEKLTSLLTAMTVHGYNNLFSTGSTASPTESSTTAEIKTGVRSGSDESSEENNTVDSGNTEKGASTNADDDLLSTTSLPELRELAKNFSLALSSYLHDPDNFRKSLEGLRPTEPPLLKDGENVESSTTEDELLNFSDADIKPSTPAVPTATWGYILATDSEKGIQDDVKNSLNPDLNTADSQSFVPRYNNLKVEEKTEKSFTDLPSNHWTSNPRATQLWQKALSVNPAVVNNHFETTATYLTSSEETTEAELFNTEVLPELSEPHSQISYDLREIPPLSLNSTQIHGILIDFMNHTKSDGHNRLSRILKRLNTSEEEFLDRMKEIESNPLTKRLVLLLISECGANITKELGIPSNTPQQSTSSQSEETLSAVESTASLSSRHVDAKSRDNHSLGDLVHPSLTAEDQDSRALQLLNSLYTIASRFGRKR